MQRFGWVGQLKPEMVKKYIDLHADTWPAVLERNKDCSLQNYSIFHKELPTGEHLLFSYVEYTGDDFQAEESTKNAPSTISRPGDGGAAPSTSAALREIYAAFSRAAFGYALLHTRAHRFLDGTPEGSTGDIAQRHSQAYMMAAQSIFEMTPDIAIWELDQEGQPCICTGLGCAG